MSELPEGTVTFLFTDVVGSTALLKRHREDFPVLLETHKRLLRDAFENYGGREIDTQGDSFFVAFARAYTLTGVEFIVASSDTNLARYGDPDTNVWTLHAWIWKPNPNGMFDPWNTRVRCR